MRGFILCADDYGMTLGVSKAILNLAAKHRLSAVGCMTNFAKWPEYAKEILPLGTKIEIGIHLNLTLGLPLTRDQPAFMSAGVLVRRAVLGQLNGCAIEREIKAQCAAFEDAMQRQPDFIDGHQHVHALPIVRQALMRVVNQRYKLKKPWLRDPSDKITSILARGGATSKALIVKGLAAGFGKLAKAYGIETNQGFSGFSAFDPARDYAADFERFLVSMGEKHLIMCHPGFVDDELRKLDPVVETRQQEYDFLLSEKFDKICERQGLGLRLENHT
jgi:chitin disaccharide deacetylase